MNILIQPFSDKTLGEFLLDVFDCQYGDFNFFQAAVAYAKRSGVQYLEEKIQAFTGTGKTARVIIGIDQQGTSVEGIESLLNALGTQDLYINHDENSFITFHPKVYYFENDEKGLLVIGSGNLTQGGLYSNDEGSAIIELDRTIEADRTIIREVRETFEKWCDDSFGTVKKVNAELVESLKECDYIISESSGITHPDAEPVDEEPDDATFSPEPRTRLFGRGAGRRRPPHARGTGRRRRIRPTAPIETWFGPETEPLTGFVMTLMRTDVGAGQTTPGTSRRSPEIFIPLIARDANPDFWGWEYEFVEDPDRPGKKDRRNVRMRLGGDVIYINMFYNPVKRDLRLRSEALRSAGDIGDLIRIEKTEGSEYFDYYVEIIPQGTNDYDYYNDYCTRTVRNSQKKWGYY